MNAARLASCPASDLGCGGDEDRPEQTRADHSIAQSAGRTEICATKFGEIEGVWVEKPPGCGKAVLRLRLRHAKSRHPIHMIFVRTSQTLRRFQPVQQPRKSPAISQTHAERLRNLGQAFAVDGIRVTPGCPAFKLVQNFRPGFRDGLIGKLVPQIFNQLEAFESAKVFDSLQRIFHWESLAVPPQNWFDAEPCSGIVFPMRWRAYS